MGPVKNEPERYVSEVQRTYADVLQLFVIVGLALLFLTFILFAAGLLPEVVAPQRVPELWDQPAHEFIAQTSFPDGWSWLSMLHFGDVLTLGALAFLATGTIVCFTIAIVLFIKKGDRAYAVMVALQVVVLIVAASGAAGGH